MSRLLPLLAVALVLSAAGGRAIAQESPPASGPRGGRERSLDQLFEFVLEERLGTVVAASRKEQRLMRAAAAVTVLDSTQIRQMAVRHPVELLRAIPSVQVVEIGPGNFSVSLRGMGGMQSNNLVVMVDELVLNNPADGNVPWANLPLHLDDIERVEVVRGPVSTIYGADAFTGVVLFRTRSGKGAPGLRGGAQAGVGIGTPAKPRGDLHGWLAGASKDLSWRVGLTGEYDQTFTDTPRDSQPALARGAFLARAGWTPHPRVALDGSATTSWSRASATDSLVLEPQPHDTLLAGGNLQLSLLNLQRWLPSLKVAGRAHMLQRSADTTQYFGFNYDGTRTFTANGRIALDFRLPLGIELQTDLESSVVDLDAAYVHPLEQGARWTHAARLRAEVDIAERVTLEAGARADISSFTPAIVPSVRGSAVYHRDDLSLRLTAGSAYRNPTFVEAGSRFTDPVSGLIQLEGNGSLRPPRLSALELGAITGLWRNRVVLRPTAYIARATNLVVGDFDSVVRRTFFNDTGAINLLGGELEYSWQALPKLFIEGFVAGVYFLTAQENPSATVGNPDHNSRFSFRVAARGTLLQDRLTLAGAANFSSARLWNVRTGVPPVLFPRRSVPPMVRLEASAEWALATGVPLSLQAQVLSSLPSRSESAFVDGDQQGTVGMLKLRYARQ